MSALAQALGLPYLAQKIFGTGGASVPANAILQEDGFGILQEDNTNLLQEG